MSQPLFIYIDVDNSTHDVVTSSEAPTRGDRDMVAANLSLVLRVAGETVERLAADGRWTRVEPAELVVDPMDSSGERAWHGPAESV